MFLVVLLLLLLLLLLSVGWFTQKAFSLPSKIDVTYFFYGIHVDKIETIKPQGKKVLTNILGLINCAMIFIRIKFQNRPFCLFVLLLLFPTAPPSLLSACLGKMFL